jgi:hypothetical protein
MELAAGIAFFSDNNDFLGGKTLQQSPVYSMQGHLIYGFRPGAWVAISGNYYTGGVQPSMGSGGTICSKTRGWV